METPGRTLAGDHTPDQGHLQWTSHMPTRLLRRTPSSKKRAPSRRYRSFRTCTNYTPSLPRSSIHGHSSRPCTPPIHIATFDPSLRGSCLSTAAHLQSCIPGYRSQQTSTKTARCGSYHSNPRIPYASIPGRCSSRHPHGSRKACAPRPSSPSASLTCTPHPSQLGRHGLGRGQPPSPHPLTPGCHPKCYALPTAQAPSTHPPRTCTRHQTAAFPHCTPCAPW